MADKASSATNYGQSVKVNNAYVEDAEQGAKQWIPVRHTAMITNGVGAAEYLSHAFASLNLGKHRITVKIKHHKLYFYISITYTHTLQTGSGQWASLFANRM